MSKKGKVTILDEDAEIERELLAIPISEARAQISLLSFVRRHGAKLRARKDEGASWESLAEYVRGKLGQPLKTSSLKSYMASFWPHRRKPVRVTKQLDTPQQAPVRPAIGTMLPPHPGSETAQQTERAGSNLPTTPKRRN